MLHVVQVKVGRLSNLKEDINDCFAAVTLSGTTQETKTVSALDGTTEGIEWNQTLHFIEADQPDILTVKIMGGGATESLGECKIQLDTLWKEGKDKGYQKLDEMAGEILIAMKVQKLQPKKVEADLANAQARIAELELTFKEKGIEVPEAPIIVDDFDCEEPTVLLAKVKDSNQELQKLLDDLSQKVKNHGCFKKKEAKEKDLDLYEGEDK